MAKDWPNKIRVTFILIPEKVYSLLDDKKKNDAGNWRQYLIMGWLKTP